VRMRRFWKTSFMHLSVWSWPWVSYRPGKWVAMWFVYFGPFCLLVKRYALPR